ncbi:MAG: aldehyde ferredoxin oxidoreductase [Chitinivibrionales bacterium]|nr:aldehyde ferredoxin oxidoreductase [Chitinivibrionales bacterium]
MASASGGGWHGQILHVNLTDKTTWRTCPDPDVYHNFIGGKGLAGTFLRDAMTLPWDDSAMPLLLFTGPLNDTISPTSGRMTIMSKSPLTGTVGDTSVGGSLGTMLKRCGVDGVVITGASATPCGIELGEGDVTFTDATRLRGRSASERFELLRDRGPVALIGPAAEQGVAFASIIVEKHYASGRNGLGLICASKNLLYLCAKGSQKTQVVDPAGLKRAREDIMRLTSASPILLGEHGIAKFGTGALYDLLHVRRMMPTANFTKSRFEHAGAMNAHAYKNTYGAKKTGCKGCHVLCKKLTPDKKSIPEFETMSHFSALLENRDLAVVMEANELCNHYGMDTISAAATLACYAEIIGTRLSPGEIIALLHAIGTGAGIGRELGRGSLAYARAQGRPEASMTVKGLELPAYDPRGAYGMALAYVTSTRGGCHLRAYPISHEILRKPVATDRFTFEGKARIIKIAEDCNAAIDSLTACKFLFFGATVEEYAKAFSAVTGASFSGQDLLNAGERIYYHDRIMNALNGFDATQDDLPRRFFELPGSSGGGIEIPALKREDFLTARARYYNVRGLTPGGLPTGATASRLGLTWNI